MVDNKVNLASEGMIGFTLAYDSTGMFVYTMDTHKTGNLLYATKEHFDAFLTCVKETYAERITFCKARLKDLEELKKLSLSTIEIPLNSFELKIEDLLDNDVGNLAVLKVYHPGVFKEVQEVSKLITSSDKLLWIPNDSRAGWSDFQAYEYITESTIKKYFR